LVVVGFLGGYTTFSTYAFESVTLWQRGEWGLSIVNLAGSVVAGCAAVILGAALAAGVVQPFWNRVSKTSQSGASAPAAGVDVDRRIVGLAHSGPLDPHRATESNRDESEC
jgi:hypothetical protein